MGIKVINLREKLKKFDDLWSPKIITQMNDYHIKLAKVKGKFVWHKHDDTDEFFLVMSGKLTIELRDRKLELCEGDIVVIPKGVEHRPNTKEGASIMLIEPTGTQNTGDAKDTEDKTSTEGEWI